MHALLLILTTDQGIGAAAMSWAFSNLDDSDDSQDPIVPPMQVQTAWDRSQEARRRLLDLPNECVWSSHSPQCILCLFTLFRPSIKW